MLQIFFFSVLIISVVLDFVGLIVNLFIAVINYKTWVQSHGVSSSDRILFSLGMTRFLMMGMSLVYIFCLFISPNVERFVYLPNIFLLVSMFLDSSSLWFVTLLNVLYCVTIANLKYSIFLLLKRNLSPKTPRLLLACVLLSAFTMLLYIVLRQKLLFPEFVTTERNGTEFNADEGTLSVVISLFLNSFLQFIINVTSASLLINSLRRHIQKMQRNATGFWNPQTEAHVGAIKLMAYFLLLYIPYTVATLFQYFPSKDLDLGTRSICIIISTFYIPGHSVLIVLTHPKLKSKAKKIICFNK
ncbi:taste receptor type 2 member 4 [Myotis daubentonii]|uniref:taste receptor type 2 member 4 n=1 Tax=Myotis daubentonii TaxID=98922 RepID=UPI0028731E98|nr:taste receptor type 2 member 4 [Myotis daubentonii]